MWFFVRNLNKNEKKENFSLSQTSIPFAQNP
jgi:hypothetical protein